MTRSPWLPLSVAKRRNNKQSDSCPNTGVRRANFFRRALGTSHFLLLLGCDITSDGSVGDPLSEPTADVLGDGQRLREVVGEPVWFSADNAESVNCESPSPALVKLSGQVVVAIDRFDETGEGALGNMYITDVYAEGEELLPYSGITVFAPSFSPPDLRLFEGDVVDTNGNLTEFLGPTVGKFGECKTLPEISGTMSLRFDGGGIYAKSLVEANGGATRWEPVLGYANARQSLGMLVRFEGVRIAGAPEENNGRYTAAIDMGAVSQDDQIYISNELFDLEADGPALADGAQFAAVTGVLTYFYGFKIAPRSIDDFEE